MDSLSLLGGENVHTGLNSKKITPSLWVTITLLREKITPLWRYFNSEKSNSTMRSKINSTRGVIITL